MSGILDKVAQSRGYFEPASIREYIGLQLAFKLGDLDGLNHFIAAANQHSLEVLRKSYQYAVSPGNGTRAARFLGYLESLTGINSKNGKHTDLSQNHS